MELFCKSKRFSIRLYWVIALVFVLAVSSCDDSGGAITMQSGDSDPTAPPSGDSDPTAPLCDASGAQRLVDMTTPIAGYTWNDPHVIKEGPTTYWMYASATDNFVFPVVLFRFGSSDGLNWALDPPGQTVSAPMLLPGGAAGGVTDTWDDGGIETAAVVFFNGNYHLFYTTYQFLIGDPSHSVLNFRIGHAVSADGVTGWMEDADPLVSPSGVFLEFNESVVAEPGPVVFNGELYLYFTAMGANLGVGTTLQVIGLTKSADGVTWTTPVSVMEPDQTIYPRGDGWIGYSTPNAVVHNSEMHLFLDVANEIPAYEQVRLHHARSADGETGWVQDTRPLLLRESLAWTASTILGPSALDDNGELRLYFSGNDFPGPNFGIGVTSCPGVAW